MRILDINIEGYWGGGERQTCNLLKGFADAGHEGELLCRGGSPLSWRARQAGIKTHPVRGYYEAVKFIARHGSKFDVIHAETPRGQTLAVLTRPVHKRPVAYTRRVYFAPRGYLTGLKYFFTGKVIAISRAVKEILEGFGVRDIEVIPDSCIKRDLDRGRAEKLLRQLGVPERKKIISTMAALVPHKDPLTMVAAVKELSLIRNDFVFVHFGGGPLKGEVEKAIAREGLRDIYLLAGFHNEPEDFYSIMDVFAMSSVQEGLGSSVLDAFLYKVPVVTTDAGGLKETVSGRGYLCPSMDPKRLARQINTALEDKAGTRELAEAAYQGVIENYSLSGSVEKYLNVFGKLTASGPRLQTAGRLPAPQAEPAYSLSGSEAAEKDLVPLMKR